MILKPVWSCSTCTLFQSAVTLLIKSTNLFLFVVISTDDVRTRFHSDCVHWALTCSLFQNSGRKIREFPTLLYYLWSPPWGMALLTQCSFSSRIQVVFPLREVCEVAPVSCLNYYTDWWHQLFRMFSSLFAQWREQMTSSTWLRIAINECRTIFCLGRVWFTVRIVCWLLSVSGSCSSLNVKNR